jgi:hypothetical protein
MPERGYEGGWRKVTRGARLLVRMEVPAAAGRNNGRGQNHGNKQNSNQNVTHRGRIFPGRGDSRRGNQYYRRPVPAE